MEVNLFRQFEFEFVKQNFFFASKSNFEFEKEHPISITDFFFQYCKIWYLKKRKKIGLKNWMSKKIQMQEIESQTPR